MTTTKEDIKKWLKILKKDREWLANQCGVSKRQVDNWLSSSMKIPSKAILIIQQLMNGETNSSTRIVIDFTDEEWEIICEAMKAHKETFMEFVNTAIQNAAKEKEAARKQFSSLEVLPVMDYSLQVIGNIAAGGLQEGDTIPYNVKSNRPLEKDEYVLRVEGKSMEPVIADGALVIMRKLSIPFIPKVGTIVEYNDERGVTLKKLAQKITPETGEKEYILLPINPDYGEIYPMDGGRISAVYVETLDKWERD